MHAENQLQCSILLEMIRTIIFIISNDKTVVDLPQLRLQQILSDQMNLYCYKWTTGGKERHQASQLPVTAQRLLHADLIINQKHQPVFLHHEQVDQHAVLQHLYQELVTIHDH